MKGSQYRESGFEIHTCIPFLRTMLGSSVPSELNESCVAMVNEALVPIDLGVQHSPQSHLLLSSHHARVKSLSPNGASDGALEIHKLLCLPCEG
jgi:hypothetical protein